MNFGKAIAKLEKRLKWVDKEIEEAKTLQSAGIKLPEGKLDLLVARHKKNVDKLEDLERIIKNRIFQWYGLDYFNELERQIEESELDLDFFE